MHVLLLLSLRKWQLFGVLQFNTTIATMASTQRLSPELQPMPPSSISQLAKPTASSATALMLSSSVRTTDLNTSISKSKSKPVQLPKTTAFVFANGLIQRTLLPTNPPTVHYTYTQAGRKYSFKAPTSKVTSTSNFIQHY